MDLKNWEKKIAVKKVERVLENYGFKVSLNPHVEVHGDLIGLWKKNNKSYMFYITAKLLKSETDSQSFKNSLKFCVENKMKLIVVCWEYENRLYDFSMDLEEGKSLPFKVIEFDRMDKLNKDWETLQSIT